MNDAEIRALLDKILKASQDQKGAHVAAAVFINKAEPAEALVFLPLLESRDQAQKKLARHVLGQMGITEAVEPLMKELREAVSQFTFRPENEYQEAIFFPNIIDIFETLFGIIAAHDLKLDELLTIAEAMLDKTRNEDLRFSVIKILTLLGNQLDRFMAEYKALSDKERRALYYVYSFKEHPQRVALFKTGLLDEKNFEYAVTHMLKFKNGRHLLGELLPTLADLQKLTVLKKLQDDSAEDFETPLLAMLAEDSKLNLEIIGDIIRKAPPATFPLEHFIALLHGNHSPEIIKAVIQIVDHLAHQSARGLYLEAFAKQTSLRNKTILLEHLNKLLKSERNGSGDFSQQVLTAILPFMDRYVVEREELTLAICKLLPTLGYANVNHIKTVRRQVIEFAKTSEKGAENMLPQVVRNNLNECITRLNAISARMEESEGKVKKIALLFDIEPQKIEADRIAKIKEQLQEIDVLESDFVDNLRWFLLNVCQTSHDDWKKKAAACNLLGDFGNADDLTYLKRLIQNETSLGAQVSIRNAIAAMQTRLDLPNEPILLWEPLFYMNKLLTDNFKDKPVTLANIKLETEFDALANQPFHRLFVSETVLAQAGNIERINAYLARNPNCQLVIIASQADIAAHFTQHGAVRVLLKPFKPNAIDELFQ
jgi:hypothetical protein